MTNASPYDTLGLPKTATAEQIRAAYLRQARLVHPDRNPAPEAATQFQGLHDAYERLNDPARRFALDHGQPDPAAASGTMTQAEAEAALRKLVKCTLKGSWLHLRADVPPPLSAFTCGLVKPRPSRRLGRRIERYVATYGPQYTGPGAAEVHQMARGVVESFEKRYQRSYWPPEGGESA